MERIVVAIPVKDEEARIGNCIGALLRQSVAVDDVVLLLNNCTDGTAAACRAARRRFAGLHVVERELSGGLGSAGEARRLALDHALEIAPGGLILTTDADGVAPEDWVAKTLAAMARGADVVCGQSRMTDADKRALPARLALEQAEEAACAALIDEIGAIIDPDPHDPWPRHQEQSGASIAMRAAVLRAAGGAPAVAKSEDRALVAKLRLVDARIRHEPGIAVTVSGRTEGRAAGGMAETIKRRLKRRDELADEKLEPAVDAYRRALAKAEFRKVWRTGRGGAALAASLLIGKAAMTELLAKKYFGAAWAEVQRLSPVLRRRLVACRDLGRQTRQAAALCSQLRREAAAGPEILLARPEAALSFLGREVAG